MKDAIIIRPNTSDKMSYEQVFEKDLFSCLQGLEDIKIIVDAGAYVGYVSFYLSKLYPNAKVLAFEPDLENYQMLLENYQLWGNKKIHPYHAAIWPYSANLEVLQDAQGRKTATKVKESKKGDIKGISLNDLNIDIDLLKIDIEGSEVEVFSGNTEWLGRTRNICIELHGQECSDIFFNAMQGYDYEINKVGEFKICKNIQRKV